LQHTVSIGYGADSGVLSVLPEVLMVKESQAQETKNGGFWVHGFEAVAEIM